MLWLEQESYSAPFPRIPESIKSKYSICDLSFRPFGIFEKDLEINFNETSRTYLGTQILQCCTFNIEGEPPGSDFFLDLTVGKRIECLLTLATLGGSSLLYFSTRCLDKDCNQEMEIQISAQELADLQHKCDASDPLDIRVSCETIKIRKPTGRDQLDWMRGTYVDEDVAIKTMIRTLVMEGEKFSFEEENPVAADLVLAINSKLNDIDPLVNFNFQVNCPYCEMENQYEIDLEEISIQRLHKAQTRLLESIHRIAKHYHWNEKQFFSIPPWRRSHYLALIEKEKNS